MVREVSLYTKMKTEKEKMLAGEAYQAVDTELFELLDRTADAVADYNAIRPSDRAGRAAAIKRILGSTGEVVTVNQPFHCDYGWNIHVGEGFFANFNLTILDEAEVRIGDNCFIGPNVSIYTACHPIDPVRRNETIEWAEPVTIGHNVWIGGSVTIVPGVTIGDNVTIGAGSVVTRDVPANCVAVGNPCRPVRDVPTNEDL